VVAQGRILIPGSTVGETFSRTSAPVNITVLAVPPPPTNGPAIVSIVATDPIAVVGTNSWAWPGLSNAAPAWATWPPNAPISFTNWGPKNAIFTVRRSGNTNNPISVTYSISGTASNGVDYVTLPGSVAVAAGTCECLIPIVPIDHGPPYIPKTVIVTLTQPIGLQPTTYLIGCPSRATAIIIPNWPRPLPYVLGNGCFHLNSPGPDGAWFIVESSPDLLNWSPLCTNQVVQGSLDYIDGNAPGNAHLFYQAIPTTQPTP
jgi:hypothetical protein